MEKYVKTDTKNTSTLLIYFITVEMVNGNYRNQYLTVPIIFTDFLVEA